jgi:3-oxoadipate enol-lactonase
MLRHYARPHREEAMPLVEVGGIDLYYEIHGQLDGTGPRLLNISGTGGDLRRSMPDRFPLNRRFGVLSYDQRGLGRSSKPAREYTMADYADDAASLVRSLGWAPCHVVGTSFGGMVALNLAVRHPEVIERLVLNCTSAGGASASYPLHELADLDPEEAFETRMRLMDSRWDPDADEPIPGLGPFYEFVAAQARRPIGPEELAGLRRQLAARQGHDVVGQLAAITHPTLVCAGRYDVTAPVANSELLAERMPNATLRVFEGGHLFMLQDRRAFDAMGDHLLGVAADVPSVVVPA